MQHDLSTLAAAAKGGDEQALNLLLGELQKIFKGFFIRRIGNKSEIDDLIQNSLVRVSKGLPDLRETEKLKGFAMKAALFELQDYYRGRYTGKESLYDAVSTPEHSDRPADVATSVDVENALSQLSPKARKIIELREYGYRYEEIAEEMETTEAAIKMQVKRAFEKMRQLMGALWWMLPLATLLNGFR